MAVSGRAAALVLTIALAGCAVPLASDPPARPTPAPTRATPAIPTSDPASPRIPVPASIDRTGATDASAALTAFVDQVPDGSTIVFPAAAVYLMGRGLTLADRYGLTFEGNGATLRSNGDAARASSLFYLNGGNRNIRIRNFKLVGNSTTPGIYDSGDEHAHGIAVSGGANIEIANVTVSAVWGDGLYVNRWADTVWFHDSHVVSNGRMGVAIVAGRNVTVERVAFDKVGYGVFDIEPNDASGGASNVKFLDNTVGVISQVRGKAFLFGANGATGSVVSDVTVSGNTVTGDSLDTYVTNTTRRKNIVFTNNTAKVASPGPVLYFAHVDGLTVTGNVQPLRSGSLLEIRDSTDVVTQ